MKKNNLELNLFEANSTNVVHDSVNLTDTSYLSKNIKCYIFVNWSGVLRKGYNPIEGFKRIIECNTENVANSVLEAVPKAFMRNIYVIPGFSPLNSKLNNQLCFDDWIRTLEKKYNNSLQLYRLLENPWQQ